MRKDQDEIYFDAPLPTMSNRRDAQFQQRCAKGKMELESSIIHKSLLKHVDTSQRSLEEKNGGYFNDMPETFCQREINRENFVSFNMLHLAQSKVLLKRR
jgi:hypothetical protein